MTSPGLSLFICEKAGWGVGEILPCPQQNHVCLPHQAWAQVTGPLWNSERLSSDDKVEMKKGNMAQGLGDSHTGTHRWVVLAPGC